jgi:hypothetical protein
VVWKKVRAAAILTVRLRKRKAAVKIQRAWRKFYEWRRLEVRSAATRKIHP